MGSLQRRGGGAYSYRGSKAAVNKVMQALAMDLEGEGVIVCVVHPGWVRTDMGGRQAELGPDESARGIVQLVDALTMAHSGRFYTWKGTEHPW
jgi:NAD(P)-dependent dehydrogenase (short-subunit alcohol dehydrogenase family)